MGEIDSFNTDQAFHVWDSIFATPATFVQNLQVKIETYCHSVPRKGVLMSERKFRSNHADPSTPSMTARPRKPRLSIVSVPLALTALIAVVFGAPGSPGAHVTENPRAEKGLKAKLIAPSIHGAFRIIPALAFRGGKYTVSEGDTVSQIAANAGISTAELLAANGLSWRTLIFADQQLDIPRSTSGTSAPTMSPSITRHRVDAGDTLEMIGRSFGVQPRALMTANGLDKSSRLIVGQRLVIPNVEGMGELPAESAAS
ncbi:MAG: LysM repeat protein [Alpinimonas sp.]